MVIDWYSICTHSTNQVIAHWRGTTAVVKVLPRACENYLSCSVKLRGQLGCNIEYPVSSCLRRHAPLRRLYRTDWESIIKQQKKWTSSGASNREPMKLQLLKRCGASVMSHRDLVFVCGYQESFIFVQFCEYLFAVIIPRNSSAVKFIITVTDHYHLTIHFVYKWSSFHIKVVNINI